VLAGLLLASRDVPARSARAVSEVRLRAFLDESRKPLRDESTGSVLNWGDHYVLSAVTCMEGSLGQSRTWLKDVRRTLGFDFHFSDLGRRRRELVIEGLLALDTWDAFLFETASPVHRSTPERRMRDRILRVAISELVTQAGVDSLTMETRSSPQRGQHTLDLRDHSAISGLVSKGLIPRGIHMTHSTKREPMLWIADLIASCRSDYICGRDRSLYPLLAHRIRVTRGVNG